MNKSLCWSMFTDFSYSWSINMSMSKISDHWADVYSESWSDFNFRTHSKYWGFISWTRGIV